MRQRSHGQVVNPGLRDGTGLVEPQSAAGLEQRPATDQLDRRPHLLDREVVKQDQVGTGPDGLGDLLQGVALDLDRQVRRQSP